ncbi:Gfo/Idh/MocA family protein [Paenibacillus abyssi]|uniref:Dehydrogenase n=1 Tax=Paenibacillus abyssi TaxID=1340531 RepID=A0A917LID0_9BACL|nr:Gfo/Idh/MocA family oxidoreductase [Paenibacillus abyssi]GGG26381.1 dehydrogenase [Paenibacillus abyssi]
MKVSIIGAGTMGMMYAHNIAKIKGVQPAGVCDVDRERAERAAQLCQTSAYTSLEDLLAQEQPDVVCVCLPTHLHKDIVMTLAAKGIHIICEKPIALNLEDAREMQAACDQHGVRLFIGHVVRFFPNYRDAAQKVKDGVIGEAGVAHLKRFGSFPQGSDGWYHDRAKSGGVIMDLMIHDIDYARAIFGEVESVYAAISRSDQMEYAQVTLKFKNKRIATLSGYWGYPGPFTTEFEIAGEKGIIRFNSNETLSLNVKVQSKDQDLGERVQVPRSPMMYDPYYYELAHFIQCIREGTTPIVSAEDACKAVAIALAAEQSAELGKPVNMEVFS